MVIRRAEESDITAIVGLLKSSLGEELLPKSAAFWQWKHLKIPFGPSPVLIAEDAGKLIGVRAFMPWEWILGNRSYRAIRAVDTATHPDYQGKGIFRKLTLQLVEECKAEGYNFIFNTPNKSSMPGYLSMGWTKLGRPAVRIKPSVAMVTNGIGLTTRSATPALEEYATDRVFKHSDSLKSLVDNTLQRTAHILTTRLSVEYFDWRYRKVPLDGYFCLHDLGGADSFCIFFRSKRTRFGMEGRITDVLVDRDRLALDRFRDDFHRLSGHFDFMSVMNPSGADEQLFGQLGFLPGFRVGPVVTTRNLDLENPAFLLNFETWKPGLGDLELF